MFPFHSTKDKSMDLKYEPVTVVVAAPEPVGTILGKVGIVWAGLFAGIKLGDLVLVATLVYTILQIMMLIVERIIKPILAAREVRRALRKTGVLATPPKDSKEN